MWRVAWRHSRPASYPRARAEGKPAEGEGGDDAAGTSTSTYAQFNIYRSMLAGLNDGGDFDFAYSGFARLLGSVPRAETALLPFAVHSIAFTPQLLVLVWKCLDENSAFLNHILAECDITQVRRTR